jgi:hypothetical protein
MGALTNRAEAALINSFFGKTSNFGALASRPTLYVGLFTAAPAEAGTGGTEATGTGYARVATATTDWNSATEGDPSHTENANIIDFGTAGGTWSSGSNMTHFGIWDASTSGNLLAFAALTTAKPVISGDPVSFAVGALVFTLD